ncbi:polysaccharide lyase 6 family protein [Hymenobacter terrigena]
MKKTLAGTAALLLLGAPLWAKDYKIKSAAELSALKLVAGDMVILQRGDWKDQRLVLQGTGTQAQPITLTTEAPGQVFLTGQSSLQLDGTWLVADGLAFKDGFSVKDDVVLFSTKAEWCRLTNSSIVNFDNPDKKVDYKWVSLNGVHNRVDHCYIKGKTHQGTTLVVWLADKANYHRIDHNYFADRPDLGVNGGETIRIGTSTWSMHDSYTTVENNIFNHCDGELEIISNKSCHNTIRNNVFFESSGMLTLRHGNFAEVYDNFFIGNGKPKSGGIRIIGENHKVYNNYLNGLTGTGVMSAICLVDGIPNSPLVGYWQVKNAQVVNNTIVNCAEPFALGFGKNPQRYLPPLDCTIANNLVVGTGKFLTYYDQPTGLKFENNLASGLAAGEELPAGIRLATVPGKADQWGAWRPTANSAAQGAGSNAFAFVKQDMDGQPRGTKVDVGADQISSKAEPILKETDIGPGWLGLPVVSTIRIK